MNNFFVSNLCIYKPSPENLAEMPKLAFCDPLFKRRLSQISRMTIQVVHELIQKVPEARNSKLVFCSFRGELARQLKINKSLYEDADIMPASFSISVFNAPPAAATISEGIKAGYSAVYPANDSFYDGLISAASPVLSECEKSIVFVYADELIIEEYKSAYRPVNTQIFPQPLAFACLLSASKLSGTDEAQPPAELKLSELKNIHSPQDFLELLQNQKTE